MNIHAAGLKSIRMLLFTIFTIMSCTYLHAMDVPDEFKEQAKKAITSRPASYKNLIEIFEPVLLENTKKKFEKFFSIMFHNDFPPAKHSDKTILKGFQCLYGKMAYAHKLSTEERELEQFNALYQTLALHKDAIGAFLQKLVEKQKLAKDQLVTIHQNLAVNQNLAEEILSFPCSSCAETAKFELGITHDDY